jgi:coenzyme F420-reducing hydrogenase delta subunit/formate hydrogenlyase subunit 6/NADH:ubiquinone oxidoreductase subunit I
MRVMNKSSAKAVEIKDDFCGRCSVCFSICPFDAITRTEETGEVKIDIEKCQVCGICYSACPAGAISTVYYDVDSLLHYVEREINEKHTRTLVLSCRGNTPSTCEVIDILKDQKITNFIPLRLPCVGRLSPDFFLKALQSGINKIVVVQCEEDYCRSKRGSAVNTRRLLLTHDVLEQLGFGKDALTVIECSNKIEYDTSKCVGCDKCVFICPYEAIEAEPLATPKINFEKCVGCGACALVCPHFAIQLKNSEYESTAQRLSQLSTDLGKLKTKGKSSAVLVFCCSWAEFSALDTLKKSSIPENVTLIEIPCFKGLDPMHVVEAFYLGFEGVLAVVCSEKDCKLEKGRETAQRNAMVLQKTLEKLGLAERFEVFESSPRYLGNFDKKLSDFIRRIANMPRLERRVEVCIE